MVKSFGNQGNFRRGNQKRGREPSGVMIHVGNIMHKTLNAFLVQSCIKDVVMFNQPLHLTDKNSNNPIGKTDEILGNINKYMFSFKPNEGLSNIQDGSKVFMDRNFILNLDIFLNPRRPKPSNRKPFNSGGNSRGGQGNRFAPRRGGSMGNSRGRSMGNFGRGGSMGSSGRGGRGGKSFGIRGK